MPAVIGCPSAVPVTSETVASIAAMPSGSTEVTFMVSVAAMSELTGCRPAPGTETSSFVEAVKA